MILGLAIVFLSFNSILLLSLRSRGLRARVLKRSARMWIVDFSGLIVQGLAVPLVQALLLAPLWQFVVPNLKGALAVPAWASFALSFAAVDYAYYWNHRMLHLPIFWRWHRLHHSAVEVDVFATARNSLLTPVFIVYVWINSLFVFALGDSTPFIVASSVGAALDLWRHSGFSVASTNPIYPFLHRWLILPQQHARHHAPVEIQQSPPANFGANLKWWDVLHGTFQAEEIDQIDGGDETHAMVASSAEPVQPTAWRELVWPVSEKTS